MRELGGGDRRRGGAFDGTGEAIPTATERGPRRRRRAEGEVSWGSSRGSRDTTLFCSEESRRRLGLETGARVAEWRPWRRRSRRIHRRGGLRRGRSGSEGVLESADVGRAPSSRTGRCLRVAATGGEGGSAWWEARAAGGEGGGAGRRGRRSTRSRGWRSSRPGGGGGIGFGALEAREAQGKAGGGSPTWWLARGAALDARACRRRRARTAIAGGGRRGGASALRGEAARGRARRC